MVEDSRDFMSEGYVEDFANSNDVSGKEAVELYNSLTNQEDTYPSLNEFKEVLEKYDSLDTKEGIGDIYNELTGIAGEEISADNFNGYLEEMSDKGVYEGIRHIVRDETSVNLGEDNLPVRIPEYLGQEPEDNDEGDNDWGEDGSEDSIVVVE